MPQWIVFILTLLVTLNLVGCAISNKVQTSDGIGDTGWRLVWQEEFDGEELDSSKWRAEVSCWGGGNDERQCYTDRKENVNVSDGVLKLKAKSETFTANMYPEGMTGAPGPNRTQQYTSGKIRTRGLASWTYGRISARIKLPSGLGTWPAFWMMPSEDFYGGWPLSGEIDIMEAVNLGATCESCPGGKFNRTSGALHFGGLPPDNTYWYLHNPEISEFGPWQEWRVYSLEWGEGIIRWFVDGKLFLQITSNMWYTDSSVGNMLPYAPFDRSFYLMLNLAVGGNLAEKNGGGFDPAAFPAEMLVDWVRVEQCSGDLETGRDCMEDLPWNGMPEGPWEGKLNK